MPDTVISFYSDIHDTKSKKEYILQYFLSDIKTGKWEDFVNKIRLEKDKVKQRAAKKMCPSVTISGHFASERTDGSLTKHSGFIALDFDDLGNDVELFKSLINADPYTYASWTTIRGVGVCVLFRIDGKKHRESFEGIQQYIYEKYPEFSPNLDSSCINESRARFVSFDPHLFERHDPYEVPVFKQYPKKEKVQKIEKIIYVQSDFERIIQEIQQKHIQIIPDDADGYKNLLRCGFALADKFGESGRNYWHSLCHLNKGYSPRTADKRYTSCLKAKGNGVTMGSLYYYVKKAGIEIYSPETTNIIRATSNLRKSGLTPDAIATQLFKKEGIAKEISLPVINEVINNQFVLKDETESTEDEIMNFLKMNYEIEENYITNKLEIEGKVLTTKDLNSMYVDVKRTIEKAKTIAIKEILHSNFVKTYNPFQRFFSDNEGKIPQNPEKFIHSFLKCLNTDNRAYLEKFTTKWMVSIIQAMQGGYSPLFHILCGDPGTGKTHFHRYLLPEYLLPYVTEDNLADLNKKKVDTEKLLIDNLLLIMNDIDESFLRKISQNKSLTDSRIFEGRLAYAETSEKRKRLAVLCGNANIYNIVHDPSINRRYVPCSITGPMQQSIYNSCNKTELLMACYQLHKEGYVWQILGEDINELDLHTREFHEYGDGVNLLKKYFKPGNPQDSWAKKMTLTDIKSYLASKTSLKISLSRAEVQGAGFPYYVNLFPNRSPGFVVEEISDYGGIIPPANTGYQTPSNNNFGNGSDLPF